MLVTGTHGRATVPPGYQLMGKELHVPVLSQLCRQTQWCQGALRVPAKLLTAPQLLHDVATATAPPRGKHRQETWQREAPLTAAPETSVGNSTSANNSCHTTGEGGGKTLYLAAMKAVGIQSRNQDEYKEMSP